MPQNPQQTTHNSAIHSLNHLANTEQLFIAPHCQKSSSEERSGGNQLYNYIFLKMLCSQNEQTAFKKHKSVNAVTMFEPSNSFEIWAPGRHLLSPS